MKVFNDYQTMNELSAAVRFNKLTSHGTAEEEQLYVDFTTKLVSVKSTLSHQKRQNAFESLEPNIRNLVDFNNGKSGFDYEQIKSDYMAFCEASKQVTTTIGHAKKSNIEKVMVIVAKMSKEEIAQLKAQLES